MNQIKKQIYRKESNEINKEEDNINKENDKPDKEISNVNYLNKNIHSKEVKKSKP